LPWIALGASLVLVREPSPPPAELLAASGEPIVAEQATAGAQPIAASLAGGIVLEAVRVDTARPRAGDPILLELDWKRTKKLDPGLGVFVHLESSTGETLNGDHALLSSAITLEAAPEGKTLRDLIPFTLPEDSAGKRWTAWVGLWRAAGDGTRVPVTDPGAAVVADNRIRVIEIEAH
jgi:hypothetical protein